MFSPFVCRRILPLVVWPLGKPLQIFWVLNFQDFQRCLSEFLGVRYPLNPSNLCWSSDSVLENLHREFYLAVFLTHWWIE